MSEGLHTCIATFICTINVHINTHTSLGALVPNSRDRHKKQWQPDFTRHKTHPKICFV